MTSDVFGQRRPESLDGLGHDLATGSFEEMRVKVTFSIMGECITPEHQRELVLHLNVTTRRNMARHGTTCEALCAHGWES